MFGAKGRVGKYFDANFERATDVKIQQKKSFITDAA
jgi:hypothetical protein